MKVVNLSLCCKAETSKLKNGKLEPQGFRIKRLEERR